MPTHQHLEQIEQKPKEIEFSSSWSDPGKLLDDPEVEKVFKHLLIPTCVEANWLRLALSDGPHAEEARRAVSKHRPRLKRLPILRLAVSRRRLWMRV